MLSFIKTNYIVIYIVIIFKTKLKYQNSSGRVWSWPNYYTESIFGSVFTGLNERKIKKMEEDPQIQFGLIILYQLWT